MEINGVGVKFTIGLRLIVCLGGLVLSNSFTPWFLVCEKNSSRTGSERLPLSTCHLSNMEKYSFVNFTPTPFIYFLVGVSEVMGFV